MITQLNPRRRKARDPVRDAFRLLRQSLAVLTALLAANLIGCNNLSLTPRSIVTISGITSGRIAWQGTTTVTREPPKVTLALQPGSTPVTYYQGEARYLQPSGAAQLPEVKFPFSAYLAFPDSGGGIGVATQPITKEFTLDGIITREMIDFSSRQTKTPESYDITAVITLWGKNFHGDEIKTILQVPILFNYS
ncbi:MAG TPA: hypothetical protein V6C82_00875 [Chroococcales cyanobacterium]|jgi:hypothetical protein